MCKKEVKSFKVFISGPFSVMLYFQYFVVTQLILLMLQKKMYDFEGQENFTYLSFFGVCKL